MNRCHWNVVASIKSDNRVSIEDDDRALPFQAHTKGESHHNGGDAGTETHRGEHEDSK